MIQITTKNLILAVICIGTALLADGQVQTTVRSSEIDRSIDAVDVSVHAEVDGHTRESLPSRGLGTSPVSLSFAEQTATSPVWPYAAVAGLDAADQGGRLEFSSPSFRPSAQAPLVAVWPSFTTAAARTSARGSYPETPDLHPKVFGASPTHLILNASTPFSGSGSNARILLSAPLDETSRLAGPFGRDKPEANSGFFQEVTFSKYKGQNGARRRKRSEHKVANGASMVASPEAVAPAKH
jgi:hypothetical protein